MSEIEVRTLNEREWAAYRAVRLQALRDSPEAFSATYDEEAALGDDVWMARLERAPRFLASRDGEALGVASLGTHRIDLPGYAEVFGLWVTPQARGAGVAAALVQAATDRARRDGRSHLVYWVGTDNGRAVAFASGLGFRPADDRRPMRGVHHEGDEEIAMVLALGPDRAAASPRV